MPDDLCYTTFISSALEEVKEIRRRVKLGESYASAASYLKRNSAWKVRLSHIKAETLVRYAKDRKKTSEIESVNSSHESAAKEEIKSKSSMPKCGIIRGMRKSTFYLKNFVDHAKKAAEMWLKQRQWLNIVWKAC